MVELWKFTANIPYIWFQNFFLPQGFITEIVFLNTKKIFILVFFNQSCGQTEARPLDFHVEIRSSVCVFSRFVFDSFF